MVRIRPGTADDLPAIRRIQTAALAEPWPDLLDLATGDGGPRLSVADDGEPVGYVVALTAGHPVAYVPELAVRPDRQGEGVGSALIDALIASLDEAAFERVRLTARATDDAVRAFYRDRGFEAVERVPGHFEGGDGVVLERRL